MWLLCDWFKDSLLRDKFIAVPRNFLFLFFNFHQRTTSTIHISLNRNGEGAQRNQEAYEIRTSLSITKMGQTRTKESKSIIGKKKGIKGEENLGKRVFFNLLQWPFHKVMKTIYLRTLYVYPQPWISSCSFVDKRPKSCSELSAESTRTSR